MKNTERLKNINNSPAYQDIRLLHENCLPARSYFVPSSGIEESMRLKRPEDSGRRILLSGQWRFRYYKSPMLIAEEALAPGGGADWDIIPVPSCWQALGYETPFYVNNDVTCANIPPFVPNFNPCGVYKKTYDMPEALSGKRLTLSFYGVCSGFSLFVNGEYAGYGQGSHNANEFDVSDFLKPGENDITAVVYKWTDGHYLETQDMFRYNGIFRDVVLTVSGEACIYDFHFDYRQNGRDFDCCLTAELLGGGCTLTGVLTDEHGKEYAAFSGADAHFTVKAPALWSAERPKCYYLYLSLMKDGKELECVRKTVGFKTVDYTGPEFKINGTPIKIKGVNHHDSNPKTGYVLTREEMLRDLRLMKRYNCNTVRFSHYPPIPEALEMCSELGLYVIDEADLESYGSLYLNNDINYFGRNPEYADAFLDRAERLYERDKNNVCVIMWSLGNEAGTGENFDLAYRYLKEKDPAIPVQYETCFREGLPTNGKGYDLISMMYTAHGQIEEIMAEDDKRPFYLCEYGHSMGLGPGGLKEYWDIVYRHDRFIGGCIWEFCDHAVYHARGKYRYTYGGDHGEYVHDSNFCCDGMFLPDRKPSTSATEVKYAYRPVLLHDVKTAEGRISFSLYNSLSFLNSDRYKIICRVLEDGHCVSEEQLDGKIAPLSQRAYSVPLPENARDTVLQILTLSGGETVGIDEAVVVFVPPAAAVQACGTELCDSDGYITVKGGDTELRFNKLTCTVDSYRVAGRETVNASPLAGDYNFYSGPVPGFRANIWRAPTDNDLYIKEQWKKHFYGMMWSSFYEYSVKNDGDIVITAKGVFSPPKYGIKFSCEQSFTVHKDMSLTVALSLTPEEEDMPMLPLVGMTLEMPPAFENVEYYGLGPGENYPDMRLSALTGRFKTTVSDMHTEYLRPQENGARGGVRSFSVTDAAGAGLCFSMEDRLLGFSAKHYTVGQLEAAAHPEDLKPSQTTQIMINGFTGGIGSNSCGPLPEEQYMIKPVKGEPIKFSFTVSPVRP